MREVRLIHNPFTEQCSVYFDEKKYGTSTISAYLKEPFWGWADKIIEAISDECNDDYNLTYVGQEFYGRILKHFVLTSSLCQRISIVNPSISDSVKSRLGKLNQICLNGFEIPRLSKQITIYSDLPVDKVQAMLPKPSRLMFCKTSFDINGLDSLPQSHGTESCFIVSEKPPCNHLKPIKCFYFQMTHENKFCGIVDNVFWEKCEMDALGKRLSEYIEAAIMTPLLHNIVQEKNADKYNPLLQSFYMLDKTEPEYLIKIPAAIEFGKREQIQCEVLPNGASIPCIKHSVLDNTIFRISDNYIEAIGTGDTFIDSTINNELISHQRIKAYRRNRATEISFPFESVNMFVGEELSVHLTYSPTNADNIPLVKFDVVGSTVSLIRQGEETIIVKALSPGESKIIVKLENLKARSMVLVLPKLIRLKIVSARQSIAVGDIIKIKIQPEPSDALVGDLQYEIVPSHIARYDATIKAIVGQKRGEGKIIVTDAQNDIKSDFDFNVI